MSFAEPSSSNVLDVWGSPYGGVLKAAVALDFDPDEIGDGGIEIFDGNDWVEIDLWFYSTEFPDELSFNHPTIADPLGKPWRLVNEGLTWTAGGNPLCPTSGTIVDFPVLLMGQSRAKAIEDFLSRESKFEK